MRRSPHSARLERWLGADRIAHLQACMANGGSRWYGRPIHLLDVPGSVRITADGDFIGPFERGYFASAMDSLEGWLRRAGRVEHGLAAAGFTSVGNALLRASGGYSQRRQVNKVGASGVVAVTNTLFRVGAQPAAGGAASAAPGGRACDNTTVGALAFANPPDGTLRLVGADMGATVVSNALILYDRLFDVTKTMSSSATEAVTGVPTRYQSATATSEDFAGDNFLMIETRTTLSATAHNWTTCLYTDESGNTGQTLPSVTGTSTAANERLDQPAGQWFAPLATGDVGIKALTQMQCSSAALTGAIDFVIGHPIGFMAFPVLNMLTPFDWITNRDQAPLMQNGGCFSFIEPLKPTTTATTYTGRIVATAAP